MLCSCHFNETNENPIPYFEGKREQITDNDIQAKISNVGSEVSSNYQYNIGNNPLEHLVDERSLLQVQNSDGPILKDAK